MTIPPVSVQREQFDAASPPPLPQARDEVLAGVPVHVLEPESVVGTYLHLHGGGWTMGGATKQDPRLWRTATECGVRVVSVEYRLAPEHPWPAAADDCEAVARALDGPLVVGGESAGAHLSAVVAQRLRGRFVGANLVYGCYYDLGMTPSQRLWGDVELVLSTPLIEWHLDQLLPGLDREARRHPCVSPLYAAMDDLPPALVTVGTNDPMLDDSLFLAARWPGAELAVHDGGFHGFDLFPVPQAEPAIATQHEFIRRVLA